MQPDERAAKGLFLAFQYPLEIPGVATMTFLRTALNAQRKKRGEAELSTPEFLKLRARGRRQARDRQDMLRRGVNVGFSGGEKKRNEILQMALLQPRLCVLDETDSGLDIDALKIVSDGVNRLRSPERAMVVITHYQRLLDHIVPDVVHVLSARPHREDRRQGARARARSQGLRAIPGRGGARVMNAEVRHDEDHCRAGAGRRPMRRRRPSCRATARSWRCATPRSTRFDALGLPHRRVEEWKYTDLRALMREAKPLAGPPDAAAKARAKDAGKLIGDMDARRIVFVDGTFVPELSDLADLSPGLTIRSMAQALAAGDRAGRRAARQGRAGRRRGRGRAQHRADARRRRHPRRQGRDARAADPSGVRRDRRQAGLGVHPLARRDRAGRARHAGREPRRRRPDIRSTPRSSSWSATTPMSITSRSPAGRAISFTSRR